MEESSEKRGPIEKSKKGWPVNPFGVAALIILGLIALFLIGKPLLSRQTTQITNEQGNASGGRLTSPEAGEIVRGGTLNLELSVDQPSSAQEVQFWAKTYADNKWQMIGKVQKSPYKLDWQIPPQFENKAIAITSHILQKDGNVIKDPGGWREGIIILSE
ncbi:MAG: Ig-like domain-containing protein [Candidatus Curtissbacteria bacterium]|nr:Ig-like domain-containing protein [Candidatus Curtissbacteria bacterium]